MTAIALIAMLVSAPDPPMLKLASDPNAPARYVGCLERCDERSMRLYRGVDQDTCTRLYWPAPMLCAWMVLLAQDGYTVVDTREGVWLLPKAKSKTTEESL